MVMNLSIGIIVIQFSLMILVAALVIKASKLERHPDDFIKDFEARYAKEISESLGE